MIQKSSNFFINRKNSFGYAWSGIYVFFKNETHARIHLLSAIIVVILSWWCSISPVEWLFILFAISGVLITEMINTCIEKIMDFMKTTYDPKIKTIKDISAGFVLLACAFAMGAGGVILLPKLIKIAGL